MYEKTECIKLSNGFDVDTIMGIAIEFVHFNGNVNTPVYCQKKSLSIHSISLINPYMS